MTRTTSRSALLGGSAVLAAVGLVATTVAFATTATASFEPGTPAQDVHIGLDNDNASNPFIQPPGVVAPQHTDDTDLLFGRGKADLLIGGKGSDTLLGGPGADILVGGPDRGGSTRGDDVLVGDDGDDVAVWSPGDGNDLVDGNNGTDTFIAGVAVTNPDGTLQLDTHSLNRTIPRVSLDAYPRYACTLVAGQPAQQLGEYLLRLSLDGVVQNTVRLKEMERVVCPGPTAGTAEVADLTQAYPSFSTVPLSRVRGLAGAIVAPVG